MASQPADTSVAISSLQELHHIHEQPAPPTTLPQISSSRLSSTSSSEKTYLYLAYGSNLSAETFKGVRGIKPLSATNAHIPSLSLTFSLPGIPYLEPCFANTRYRHPSSSADYHKNRWHKGLIGVVYEVTPEDYRTILATEGGGASYHDILVPCYALPGGLKTVDPEPKGEPFMAHTLFEPIDRQEGISRPDPSYAQPSARYLKLITDGGEEHRLPDEYMAYLYNIRPYTITTFRQKAGRVAFLAVWAPLLLLLTLGKFLADEEGKAPAWYAALILMGMKALWRSYDGVYRKVFGDGERTIGDGDGDEEIGSVRLGEKGFKDSPRI